MEGAVLSYEANLESGGSGARYLGIGQAYNIEKII